MYCKVIKRILDVILAMIAAILLIPLLIILMIAIKADSKGPIIFKQKRVGKDKTYFYIWKFRTMVADTPTDCPTHLLKKPERYITKIGSLMRKTSLDELPQIYNILCGDMSIVGPRPALWNQYDLIEQRDRYGANAVRPGLTGWAQVNGRDELSIEAKSKLDGEYVKRLSLGLDLICIFKTIIIVFTSEGVREGENKS